MFLARALNNVYKSLLYEYKGKPLWGKDNEVLKLT